MLKLYFTNFKRLFRKFLVSSRNWIGKKLFKKLFKFISLSFL